MILVIAGTTESKDVIAKLCEQREPFIASVATNYGHGLFSAFLSVVDRHSVGKIIETRFTLTEAVELVHECGVKKIIDASHPFALTITAIAKEAARLTGAEYVRIDRTHDPVTKLDNVHVVGSFEEAADLAVTLGQRVFLTIGTRNLGAFTDTVPIENLIVRVLDWESSLRCCRELGIDPSNMISGKGPFSIEENIKQFIAFKADVVVTKNSGTIGGCKQKITAAHTLGLPIVVVERPSSADIPSDPMFWMSQPLDRSE